jgi:hypothetical protein
VASAESGAGREGGGAEVQFGSDGAMFCIQVHESPVSVQLWNMNLYIDLSPITVASRSKAWCVFVHSNVGIVGLNPT